MKLAVAIQRSPDSSAPDAQRGLTLVEILLSMLLLSGVVLGSLSLLSISSRQNKLAQHRSIATSLAAERIDLLTAARFSNAAEYADYAIGGEVPAAGPPMTLTADYGAVEGFAEFRRVVTLDYDVPESGLLKAKVEIFWQDPKQGEKQHRLVSLLHPSLEQR